MNKSCDVFNLFVEGTEDLSSQIRVLALFTPNEIAEI